MNIKLIIAYDGTSYLGWQEVGDGPTIEETLRQVLEMIYQEKIVLQAASRTDKGVHAEGQVVNFFTQKEKDLKRLKRSLNQLLPPTIQIKDISIAPETFHPTLEAIGKEYHYHLSLGPVQSPFQRHYSWHLPAPLNIPLMKQAAASFIGTHNFAAFCNACDPYPKDTIRTLNRISLVQEGENLRIEVEGNSFLYKMVRNLVGTLVYIGNGKLSIEEGRKLIDQKDRTLAGMTAPAHGLILNQVFYPCQIQSNSA